MPKLTPKLRSTVLALMMTLGASPSCKGKPEDPRVRIQATLNAVEIGVESRDIDAVLEHLTETFRDGRGGDAKELRSLMQMYFLRQGSVHALLRTKKIELPAEDRAEVDLDVAVGGTPPPENVSLEGFKADWIEVKLTLHRDGKDWKIDTAKWSRSRMLE